MAEVHAQNLTKIFHSRSDTVRAVDDLTVTIPDHEFAVFVGPSGSGKTTFLRLVAGLEVPTSGRLTIGDRDVTTLHPRERGIAMVFQDYALYPHMTVAQNMSFALENLRFPRSEIEQRVNQAARLLRIEMLLDRKPRQLSGGQRQRVALGRAIVRKPEVFLFDEPLSNLDAKLRGQMRVELAELHSQIGTTAIYVTHDQVEAVTLGNRIFVMNEGVVQQVGSGEELYKQPANLFVASFIGTPQINLIGGRLVSDDGALAVVLDGQRIRLGAAAGSPFAPCEPRRGARHPPRVHHTAGCWFRRPGVDRPGIRPAGRAPRLRTAGALRPLGQRPGGPDAGGNRAAHGGRGRRRHRGGALPAVRPGNRAADLARHAALKAGRR